MSDPLLRIAFEAVCEVTSVGSTAKGQSYKGCGLAIFSLLVFDCHFAWFFACKDRRKRPWLRVLAFLVDLAAVAVVVIVAVEWAVGWLMSWNLSAKSHPFEWTDFSIAPKRPADYDDYYAYDYAGDYGG